MTQSLSRLDRPRFETLAGLLAAGGAVWLMALALRLPAF